jgi:hypothetical protein
VCNARNESSCGAALVRHMLANSSYGASRAPRASRTPRAPCALRAAFASPKTYSSSAGGVVSVNVSVVTSVPRSSFPKVTVTGFVP